MPVMSTMGALAYSRTTPGPYVPYLGEFIYGGYYVGPIGAYYMIVADAAVGQGTDDWNTAYSICEGLVSNGFSDWRMPTFAQLVAMGAGISFLPVGQKFTTTAGTSANYWPRTRANGSSISYPIANPTSTLVETIYFGPGGGTNLPYASNAAISWRATRLQLIPT